MNEKKIAYILRYSKKFKCINPNCGLGFFNGDFLDFGDHVFCKYCKTDSPKTKEKIPFEGKCDNPSCGKTTTTKKGEWIEISMFYKNDRHFCSNSCKEEYLNKMQKLKVKF